MKQVAANTSIGQICTKAGIAKGTFYLYFKDKDDILRALTKRISYTIIENAYNSIQEHKGFVEDAVSMADYLMNYFVDNPDLVALLKKDFVWPIAEFEFMHSDDEAVISIREEIEEYSLQSSLEKEQILFRLFAMISMICSVSYSAIIDHFPADLSSLKAEIFTMIRTSFPQN